MRKNKGIFSLAPLLPLISLAPPCGERVRVRGSIVREEKSLINTQPLTQTTKEKENMKHIFRMT